MVYNCHLFVHFFFTLHQARIPLILSRDFQRGNEEYSYHCDLADFVEKATRAEARWTDGVHAMNIAWRRSLGDIDIGTMAMVAAASFHRAEGMGDCARLYWALARFLVGGKALEEENELLRTSVPLLMSLFLAAEIANPDPYGANPPYEQFRGYIAERIRV